MTNATVKVQYCVQIIETQYTRVQIESLRLAAEVRSGNQVTRIIVSECAQVCPYLTCLLDVVPTLCTISIPFTKEDMMCSLNQDSHTHLSATMTRESRMICLFHL